MVFERVSLFGLLIVPDGASHWDPSIRKPRDSS